VNLAYSANGPPYYVLKLSNDKNTIFATAQGKFMIFSYVDAGNGVSSTWVNSYFQDFHDFPNFELSITNSSDNNYVIISGYNVGVKVYRKTSGIWAFSQTIIAPPVYINRPISLSADGITLAIGFPDRTEFAITFYGSTDIYTYNGSTWIFTIKLVNNTIASTQYQGRSVSLSQDGNLLVVGSTQADPTGGVYVFTRTAGVWSGSSDPLIVGSSPYAITNQGLNVLAGVDNNQIIFTSPFYLDIFNPPNVLMSGAVWIFIYSGGSWIEYKRFVPDYYTESILNPNSGAIHFGNSISISNTGILTIGGPWDLDASGSVWIYN
jgi:hypothetical protein